MLLFTPSCTELGEIVNVAGVVLTGGGDSDEDDGALPAELPQATNVAVVVISINNFISFTSRPNMVYDLILLSDFLTEFWQTFVQFIEVRRECVEK